MPRCLKTAQSGAGHGTAGSDRGAGRMIAKRSASPVPPALKARSWSVGTLPAAAARSWASACATGPGQIPGLHCDTTSSVLGDPRRWGTHSDIPAGRQRFRKAHRYPNRRGASPTGSAPPAKAPPIRTCRHAGMVRTLRRGGGPCRTVCPHRRGAALPAGVHYSSQCRTSIMAVSIQWDRDEPHGWVNGRRRCC